MRPQPADSAQDLQSAVKTALERAVRDNDLVYVAPVPSQSQLALISGAGMVKLATPVEIADPTDWMMKGGAGDGPLFSALVPYGVHLALSESQCAKPVAVHPTNV
jgi:programmed cell death 6-interacting protein